MKILDILRCLTALIAVVAFTASAIATTDTSSRDSGSGYVISDVQVNDADLDLSLDSGQARLYHRIQDAALNACDPSGESRILPIYNRPDSGDCYSETINATLEVYDNESLKRIHDRLRRPPVFVN